MTRNEKLAGVLLFVFMLFGGISLMLAFVIIVQNKYGPGVGSPWKLSYRESLVAMPCVLLFLCFGMMLGTVIGAYVARLVTSKQAVRMQLTQPGIPLFSWFGRTVADLVCGESE